MAEKGMKFPRALLLLLACSPLAACAGPGTQQLVNTVTPDISIMPDQGQSKECQVSYSTTNKSIFFAAPVCDSYILANSSGYTTALDADASSDPKVKIEYVSAAIGDSWGKCEKLIGLFTGAQSGENTLFDISGLILSGLGSVFTAANTVRALSAASTGVQGAKQAINSDLFQQMTMMIFVQQIKANYFTPMKTLLDKASAPSEITTPDFVPSSELAEIRSLHTNCSIPLAAANASSPASAPQTAPAPQQGPPQPGPKPAPHPG